MESFSESYPLYPYKPISIGVRCKLADAVTGEVLWVCGFRLPHAGSQQTQAAALHFQKEQSSTQFPQDTGAILQSPRYFSSRFIASTLMDTLPSLGRIFQIPINPLKKLADYPTCKVGYFPYLVEVSNGSNQQPSSWLSQTPAQTLIVLPRFRVTMKTLTRLS